MKLQYAIKQPIKKLLFMLRMMNSQVKAYDSKLGYVIHSYNDKNGNFDYEQYKKAQVDGNKKKIDKVWALEENIKFLAEYFTKKIPGGVKFGLCHGTRRGVEQEWFSKYIPGAEVIGTEISDTATQFPKTIQWDFHEVKPEWVGKVDFIYSNSYDHSFDPKKCINAWMSCLKPGGLCVIEHSTGQLMTETSQMDPFGAELAAMPFLMAQWSGGKFGVKEIIDAPKLSDKVNFCKFIVLQNFN